MKTYIIYRAFNKQTNKNYIGRTSSTLNNRISWHYSNASKRLHKNNLFFDALLEYEKEDWVWEVLDSTASREESYRLEAEYIQKYDSVKNGYNTKGSDLIPWNKGKKMSDEYRANLMGEKNPMFGKTHSEEYRKWRSEHMSKVQLGKNNHMARKVYCIELKKTWDTVKDAAEELGINKDSISNNCRGVTKSAGGYRFKYVDGKGSIKIESKLTGSNNPKARRVACPELNKQWNTIKECAEEIGITPQAISKVCQGKGKTVKGLRFYYID